MHTPGARFSLRCFRQTLSVSIFLLTFPWQAQACLDGHNLLLNSLGTRADGPPSLSQIEALRPIRHSATDAAVIGIAISGCVVGSHGTCGIQISLCASADHIWPALRRFSVHPPAHALPRPGRGLALYPECVYMPIYPFLAHFPAPQDMCICMLSVISPSPKYGLFFPPRGHESEYEGALSRRVHAPT